VKLEPGNGYTPVKVAVWDSEIDTSIFKDRLVKDSSGNPEVIAYDIQNWKTTGQLYPLTAGQPRAKWGSAFSSIENLAHFVEN
jgi:hypothetical protein